MEKILNLQNNHKNDLLNIKQKYTNKFNDIVNGLCSEIEEKVFNHFCEKIRENIRDKFTKMFSFDD